MTDNDYEAGKRDGRIEAIESMQKSQNDRLNHHERRLQYAERILYGLIGALVLTQILPALKSVL